MSETEPRWLSRLVVDAIQADMLLHTAASPDSAMRTLLNRRSPVRGSASPTNRRPTLQGSPLPTGMASSATTPTTMATSVSASWPWPHSWA